MALLYPEQNLNPCLIKLSVHQKNGDPASFAVVDVFQVNKFLWWEYDSWVTMRVTDYYGKVNLDLTKGRKYHLRIRWQGKERNEKIKLTICPWPMDVYMP